MTAKGSDYNPEACDILHKELDRRLTDCEQDVLTLKEKRDTDLGKIYTKIETQTLTWAEKAAENARRPGWATTVILSLLSSGFVGAVMFIITKR